MSQKCRLPVASIAIHFAQHAILGEKCDGEDRAFLLLRLHPPMNILLHTIALEPARWTPARVSRPLVELLPAIAGAGFYQLEIFEPHLDFAPDEEALRRALAEHHLLPRVLSSYLELTPHKTSAEVFSAQADRLLARVDRFGFQKVRLFPGAAADPSAGAYAQAVGEVARRVRGLAEARPEVEFLFETHDGGLADDPEGIVWLSEEIGRANVGLLWQPTVFDAEAARAQFALQREHVRHLHLQNRVAGDLGQFATLRDGVVPWREILGEPPFGLDGTLEFVPAGICAPEEFDLTATLQQAVEEFQYLVALEAS